MTTATAIVNDISLAVRKHTRELNRTTANAIADLTLARTNNDVIATDVVTKRLVELMSTYGALVEELQNIAAEVRFNRAYLDRTIDAIHDTSA